ncbi:MAG: T9SS type A sorting domain-containing protein, partial [Ignavibacteria bacterium]
SYHSLGTGFSSGGSNVFGAFALTIFNNNLIAGGIFSSVNGVGAGNIAQWNGLSVTGIHKPNGTVADNYSLSQNYPNPFNPSTKIKYQIPNQENVKLTVYDILGNEVATLVNEKQSAGTHEISWNAANVSSGVYLYKITAGSYSDTRRMSLIK